MEPFLERWKRAAQHNNIKEENLAIATMRAGYIELELMYNPNRAKRPDRLGLNQKLDCSFCDWIRDEKNIFDRQGDYCVGPNTSPIMTGHTIIIHKDHNAGNTSRRLVTKEDLETMMAYSTKSKQRIFRNMLGAAATYPDHEHFQGVPHILPIERLTLTALAPTVPVYTVLEYPGENLVFLGGCAAETAAYVLAKIHAQGIVYNIVLVEDRIYLIPRKNERSEITGERVGGLELGGKFVVTMPEKYEELRKNPNLVSLLTDALAETVWSRTECALWKYLPAKYAVEKYLTNKPQRIDLSVTPEDSSDQDTERFLAFDEKLGSWQYYESKLDSWLDSLPRKWREVHCLASSYAEQIANAYLLTTDDHPDLLHASPDQFAKLLRQKAVHAPGKVEQLLMQK